MTREISSTLIFLLFIFTVGFFLFKNETSPTVKDCGGYERRQLTIFDKKLEVEVADSDCKRTLGLSGRKKTTKDTGMLFVFSEEAEHTIWMKDMKFSIDVLWLNSEGEVVWLEKNVSPDNYPDFLGEGFFSKFVLETSSGFIEENNIQIGDKIII